MAPDAFRLRVPLRVRWAEVDPQGIVFNPNYLMYVDLASTEYWRQVGLPYPGGLDALGGDVVVKKATLEYHRPARFDDVLDLGFRCTRIGRTSLTFEWAAERDREALVSGELVYVLVDARTATPLVVPDALRSTLLAFEQGEEMFEVHVGGWETLGADARAIREKVFIDEQAVPRDIEEDGEDPRCLHVLVKNRLGTPAATARLLMTDGPAVRVGRVAVLREFRGSGVGRQMLQHVLELARGRRAKVIVLHAQTRASGFFERLGFRRCGEPFEEAAIPHIEMRREP